MESDKKLDKKAHPTTEISKLNIVVIKGEHRPIQSK
jgi:hypothetical protein